MTPLTRKETALLAWILAHRSRLALQMERRGRWTARFGFSEVWVSLRLARRRYEGMGSDANPRRALIKAFAEATERAAWRHSGVATDTTGFAAHPDPKEARRLAVLESLERDSFFCHHLTCTFPPQPLAPSILPRDVRERMNWLKTQGIQSYFYRLRSAAKKTQIRLCVLWGKTHSPPFGMVIGLGASAPESIPAIRKALNEAMRSAGPLLDGHRPRALGWAALRGRRRADPLDHWRIGLHLEYASEYWRQATKRGSDETIAIDQGPRMAIGDVRCEIISAPGILAQAPLFVARACDERLQPSTFGLTQPVRENRARLEVFLGTRFTTPENLLPHPLP